MDGFQDFVKEQGVDFDSLPDHEKLQILNSFLTRGLPQRSIQPGDWEKVINDVLLRVQPKDHGNVYSLQDPMPSWEVVELPATVSGNQVSGNYVSNHMIPHIHGYRHGVQPDYVTMGLVIARHIADYPGSLFVNVFQDWSGYSHCFCSIELKKNDDAEYHFIRGTFHPGFAGLIDEREIEFLGFLESYFKDESSKDGALPGRWQLKRDDTKVYRPGVNEEIDRATLIDVYTKEELQWDYLTRLVQEKR